MGAEECTILVYNYGKESSNNELLRKFIEMKLEGNIGRRSLIKIGHITTITNNALSAYTIVLSVSDIHDIFGALKQGNLLTQKVLDNSCNTCII